MPSMVEVSLLLLPSRIKEMSLPSPAQMVAAANAADFKNPQVKNFSKNAVNYVFCLTILSNLVSVISECE